jgi:hypothetical protein
MLNISETIGKTDWIENTIATPVLLNTTMVYTMKPCNATNKMELKMLNRICNILFLYKNIDIAGISEVSAVRAANSGSLVVLYPISLPGRSSHFAILVVNNTVCKMITINR